MTTIKSSTKTKDAPTATTVAAPAVLHPTTTTPMGDHAAAGIIDPIVHKLVDFWYGRSIFETSGGRWKETPLVEAARTGDETTCFLIVELLGGGTGAAGTGTTARTAAFNKKEEAVAATTATATAFADDDSSKEDVDEDFDGVIDDKTRLLQARNSRNRNALHCAVASSYIDIVRLLLRNDPHSTTMKLAATDVHGETPIHAAVRTGNVALLELLLVSLSKSKVPDDVHSVLNMRNKDGETPLHLACRPFRPLLYYPNCTSLRILRLPRGLMPVIDFENGMPVIERDGERIYVHASPPCATFSPPGVIVCKLCDDDNTCEYRINNTNINNNNPFPWRDLQQQQRRRVLPRSSFSSSSTEYGQQQQQDRQAMIRLLLQYGANVRSTDTKFGATPLHRAAGEDGYLDVVKFLVEYSDGANVIYKQDKFGRTPLQYAKMHGNKSIETYLEGIVIIR